MQADPACTRPRHLRDYGSILSQRRKYMFPIQRQSIVDSALAEPHEVDPCQQQRTYCHHPLSIHHLRQARICPEV